MDYPFVKCLHPVKMRNPYTQENITVACGKCEACLNRRAGINSFRIRDLVIRYCLRTCGASNRCLIRCAALPAEN